jgi:hypothetical protein
MAQVIDLFREEDTRDELGIGVVRDAIADLLFPGTSTIQTRARYFLFIPWIYRRHEKGTTGADVARKARRDENLLIEALDQGGEYSGVIGIGKRAALQRPASSIYWAGLGTWRIRRIRASQQQYHRAWDSLMTRRRKELVDDDGQSVDGSTSAAWDPELPEAPTELLKRTSFTLLLQEAEYLQSRILGLGNTLLGHLVAKAKPAEDVEFPWTHPEVESFPQLFREQLQHARLFSEAMNGVALLYNLMLSEERRNTEWIDHYRERLTTWSSLMQHRADAFVSWQRPQFWALVDGTRARVTFKTRRFVNGWLDLALTTSNPGTLADDVRARRLVVDREQELKRSRARLGNPRALERWNGAAGAQPLTYRWHRVRTIVADIVKGLEG